LSAHVKCELANWFSHQVDAVLFLSLLTAVSEVGCLVAGQ